MTIIKYFGYKNENKIKKKKFCNFLKVGTNWYQLVPIFSNWYQGYNLKYSTVLKGNNKVKQKL